MKILSTAKKASLTFDEINQMTLTSLLDFIKCYYDQEQTSNERYATQADIDRLK